MVLLKIALPTASYAAPTAAPAEAAAMTSFSDELFFPTEIHSFHFYMSFIQEYSIIKSLQLQ